MAAGVSEGRKVGMWEGVTSAVLGQKMFGEDRVYCKMEGGTYRTWSKLDNRDGKVGDDIQ